MAASETILSLTDAERELLIEALDSHKYWQLSDPNRRDSGNVRDPLTEAEQACDDLAYRIRAGQ